MTLNQINYFITVGRCSSISKAAKQLHVSQPAISDAIKSLEQELGILLFNRINQRLYLTRDGAYYLEKLSHIHENLNELNQEMIKRGNNIQTLKIGIPPMIGSFIFPRLFVNLQTFHLNIRLEVTEGGSLELLDKLRDESIDFAVVAAEAGKQSYHDLSHQLLSRTELLYCVSKDHHLADRKFVTMEELGKEELILFKEGYLQNQLIMDAFQDAKVEPAIILRTNQILTIITFIKSQIGTSFLFQDMAELQRDLRGISLEHPILIDLLLVWKTNRMMHKDMKQFMKLLNAHFQDDNI